MKYIFTSILLLITIHLTISLSGQNLTFEGELSYQGLVEEQVAAGQTATYLYSPGNAVDPQFQLPVVQITVENTDNKSAISGILSDSQFIPCTPEENEFISESGFWQDEVAIKGKSYTARKKTVPFLEFIPIRFNNETGEFEKLVYYKIETEFTVLNRKTLSGLQLWEGESVLKSGSWWKFKISESGIYRLSYNDLVNAGIDLNSIDPQYLSIYSNAGYMLPEPNDEPRPDDLVEIPVKIVGEDDGSFDPEDYVVFYGISPHKVSNVLGFMLYQINLYDNFNYYYLTIGQEPGKRVETVPSSTATPSHFISKFNDYQFYEEDNINLILSGKTWYAEEFGESLSRSYQFDFPEMLTNEEVSVKFGIANRTFINDEVEIKINNAVNDTLPLTSVSTNSTKYAQKRKKTYTFNTDSPLISIDLNYLPADNTSRMWLDYIYVNAISSLKLVDGQVQFRELSSVNDGAVTQFTVANTNEQTAIWELTDFLNPVQIESTYETGSTSFTVATSELREFVAFDGSQFKSPEFIGEVPNQNIHGHGPVEYVIVTHPLFMDQALRLKELHETYHGFSVMVVTPEQVYNEFSSGRQDPTAIRNMMKMFYDRNPGNEPRYLLLFGDGSFDPKDRLEHNTNFIPTFQTEESWITATSYVVDDYYGLLDEDEGDDAIGYLDIGIGRFPVKTEEEATTIVDKVERYLQPGEPGYGNWRTQICMIADDEDGNLHLEQAEDLSFNFDYIPSTFNQHKIYLDAYPQQKTPSGDKYPEVVEELQKQIDEGALIINYIGHGGTGGWAHERILQQNDILNWNNISKLPVFITATCEFSRFDEPEITSGGELVILNPQGGGIALFTTTRLAYSQSNFFLNERIYQRAFKSVEGQMPFLGDLIRESKPPGVLTTRNFVLLGDPGLRMAYPKYNINTLTINGNNTSSLVADTLRALQKVTVTGEITDNSNQKVKSFNGTIFPVLYDKATIYKTIGNDPSSYPVEFTNQDKILWKGKASVTDGKFSFSFVIPKDIALEYGQAKISYYAESETSDAFGAFEDFILGGISNGSITDVNGPEIDLYINNLDFVSGDLTHENPLLLAFLQDENGINLSSNGIGHDITLVMNDNYSEIMNITDYFEPALDDYKKGEISFPFYNLPDGKYTLTLKAWDIFNNSTEKSIDFIIDRGADLNLTNVMCHPNPFTERTTFSFEHTKPGSNLNVVLEIYNMFGKYILSYETTLNSPGTKLTVLDWDGRDVNGAHVANGIYVYTITVTDEDGQVSRNQQKFIVR